MPKFRTPISLSDEEKAALSSKLPSISWPAASSAAKKVASFLPKVTFTSKEEVIAQKKVKAEDFTDIE